MFDWLMEQAGYLQDDSFQTVTLSADDATRSYSLQIGERRWYSCDKVSVIMRAMKETL